MELPFWFRFPCSLGRVFHGEQVGDQARDDDVLRRARDNRPVAVDIAVRRDKEMQANAGMITLPVAISITATPSRITEYSFLANVFAARGYLVVSPQHDLPTDPPMVTKLGELYVGRLPQILRGVANIHLPSRK